MSYTKLTATVLQHYSAQQEAERCMFVSLIFLPLAFQKTLSPLNDFQVTLTPSLSLLWHPDFPKHALMEELTGSQSLPCLSLLSSPLHVSVLLIYQMTHHISTSDIFSLRSSSTARRCKNCWQSPNTHTYARTLSSLAHALTNVYTVCSQVHTFDT